MASSDWCHHCYNLLIDTGQVGWSNINSWRCLKKGQNFQVQTFEKLHGLAFALNATNPRDRVYDLLGLTGMELEVDHRKSISEVHMDFVEAWFKEVAFAPCVHTPFFQKSCDFLLSSGIGVLQQGPNIPSWIPDFTVSSTALPLPGKLSRRMLCA